MMEKRYDSLRRIILLAPCVNTAKEELVFEVVGVSHPVPVTVSSGLPEDFSSKDFRPCAGPYCFMEQLCELHDGLVLEAKGVKEHFWKPFIKKLFHKRVRRVSTCCGFTSITS